MKSAAKSIAGKNATSADKILIRDGIKFRLQFNGKRRMAKFFRQNAAIMGDLTKQADLI
jgi:hypothetical protein